MTDKTSSKNKRILLSHGGGGKITQDLIKEHITNVLSNPLLDAFDDSAHLPEISGSLAMTTDSFVVNPHFFPGGNIGKMAIIGTVNDLLVSGAKPLYLTLGLILEEGLELDKFDEVLASISKTSKECGVSIVTGDTKVVEHGNGDGIFINTAGVGSVNEKYANRDSVIRPGDKILVSGNIGDHGGVIQAVRSDIKLTGNLKSDCASVADFVNVLFEADIYPRFMRDPTRGGLAGVLCDISDFAKHQILVERANIPIHPDVKSIEDILGTDPLHFACEGRIVCVVPEEMADKTLNLWRECKNGNDAAIIGEVATGPSRVVMKTESGGKRILQRPSGDLLPRIC